MRSRSTWSDPRAPVDDPDQGASRRVRHLDAHGLGLRRVLERVLEQVHEHALDLHGVDPDGDRLLRKLDVDASTRLARLRERLHDQVVHRPDVRFRPERAGLQAGQIEQVVDQPGEALSFTEDRRGELPLVLRVDLEIVACERARRSQDGHQRRAQVVAHRSEHGCLHGIAAAQSLGLECFARQALAVDRDAEQRGERRQEPPPGRSASLARALEVDRPDAAAAGQEGIGIGSGGRRVLAGDDPHVVDPQGTGRLGRDPFELAAHLAVLKQQAGDLREQRRLDRPAAGARCEIADDDRRDQEDSRARTSSSSPGA